MDNSNQQLVERDYFLCQLSDLADLQSIELEIDERKLFAIRQDNQLYAYWNSCPHMGIPLNWMPGKFLDLDGALLQCSAHGALFHINSGECIGGPCVGDHLTPIALTQNGDQYFISADQPLPARLINLREAALRDLD
ncbi:Rieske [2Fe-2S] domain protein [Gammaproteobacteria bacterium MOLA455]|nr:Rieske [2Fe-2S] domain protein [Gammaproteobacteria bacterium MOLA455]